MVDRTISKPGSAPGTSRATPDDGRRTFAERSVAHLSRLHRPTATAEHAARIERQLAEDSR